MKALVLQGPPRVHADRIAGGDSRLLLLIALLCRAVQKVREAQPDFSAATT